MMYQKVQRTKKLMTKKILVWLDDNYSYLHYGICLELSKLDNFEFYGFVSRKNDYDFLNYQKKLSFTELHYYSKSYFGKQKKPDMEFLKKIEKDFGIDLWLLAYTERTFLEERNFFHKFNSNEILLIIESLLKFFLDFFNRIKPDFIIMQKTGENFANLILFHLAKSMQIKTWMLTETRLNNSFVLSDDLEGNTIKLEFNKIKNNPPNKIKNYGPEFLEKKSVLKMVNDFLTVEFGEATLKQKIQRYAKRSFVENEQIYLNRGKSSTRMIQWRIHNFFEIRKRMKFLENYACRNIPDEKFVYFPLPVQPESQNNGWAPFHVNSLSIIEHIARSIPVDFFLAVKEHQAQGSRGWRSIEFYKKILALPNTKLFYPHVDNQKMLSKCELLITINNSSGFEALFYKKPVLALSDSFYDVVSMVKRIKDFTELRKIINSQLNSFHFNAAELSYLVQSIENTQIIIPYWEMMKKIVKISSINIHTNLVKTLLEFEQFYKKYEKDFSIMAKAYYLKFN